ncbi:FHA domain-containing protein [Actinomycetospora sp. CA-053990]|uniref:FHA domain-containing protein n=1 Tax=Actinomycetospora sp. CA-053990 TaxID=3239891 RepID=UPI003D8A08E3
MSTDNVFVDLDVDAASVGALPTGSALLVLDRGPGAGRRFVLDRDTTVVGRSDSDIVLDGVTVSRRHAEFRRQGETFVVVDVGSFNGTYLNRLAVDMATLDDGDEIQIGKFRLIFHAGRPGGDS